MFGSLSRQVRLISLIAGFLLGTVGAAWSFVFVDRLSEEMRQFSDAKADLTTQMQSLNSVAHVVRADAGDSAPFPDFSWRRGSKAALAAHQRRSSL